MTNITQNSSYPITRAYTNTSSTTYSQLNVSKKNSTGSVDFDGFDFSNAGTMGDQWLNHYYGSGVNKNLDQYLNGNSAQQLSATGDSSPFEEYYDNAHDTYLRGTAAKVLYDETGIDNGDLWMWDYIPSVGVGEGILRAYEGETVDSVNTALRAGQSIEDAALSMQDFGEMKKDMNFDFNDEDDE